jgi:SulP family sulfate permease
VLFHIGGEVSFGAAKGMIKRLAQFTDYDALVLDLTEVPVIDYTATRALDTIIADAIAAGREVMLVGMRSRVTKNLKKQKVLDRVHSDYVFVKRIGALRAAAAFVKQRQA